MPTEKKFAREAPVGESVRNGPHAREPRLALPLASDSSASPSSDSSSPPSGSSGKETVGFARGPLSPTRWLRLWLRLSRSARLGLS
jgi:hypothetical protein